MQKTFGDVAASIGQIEEAARDAKEELEAVRNAELLIGADDVYKDFANKFTPIGEGSQINLEKYQFGTIFDAATDAWINRVAAGTQVDMNMESILNAKSVAEQMYNLGLYDDEAYYEIIAQLDAQAVILTNN